MSQACAAGAGQVAVGGGPLRIGPFEGRILASFETKAGELSDGTSRVTFDTDLPVDRVFALLASLRPFDPGADPGGA